MTYRLILGGPEAAKYLPVAETALKRLRAAGRPYATQQLIVEGVTITVRIEREHQYIKIEGGGCVLSVDSGVMDMGNINPLTPTLSAVSGVLRDTAATAAYKAAFTTPTPAGAQNPGTTSAGQLMGNLHYSGKVFKGTIPTGGVGALANRRDLVPASSPAAYAPIAQDPLVLTKKLTMATCPASIFTGKTRLYVQAMYGLPLYEYSAGGALMATNQPPSLQSNAAAAPGLLLSPYVASGDTTSYADVYIDTSSGVFRDARGKHWLVVVLGAAMKVYPLRSSPCGESLRKRLVDGSLSAQDTENLEAYILARSRPYASLAQDVAGSLGSIIPFSMGYGWHWNWSGTKAVIVSMSTFAQDGIGLNFGMRSQLVTATLTQTALPAGGYTWSVGLVSTPNVEWSVPRVNWCITNPSWGDGLLEKTTPAHSAQLNYADAYWYAYFKRDELQACTVSSTVVSWVTRTRTMSDGYAFSPLFGDTVDARTVGELSGELEDEAQGGDYQQAVFRIGGYVTPPLPQERGSAMANYSTDDKAFDITDTTGPFGAGTYRTSTYDQGYPTNPAGTTWNQTASYEGQPSSGVVHFTCTSSATTGTKVDTADCEIVVPFMDAEAAYLRYVVTRRISKTGAKTFYDQSSYQTDFWLVAISVYDPFSTTYVLLRNPKYCWHSINGTPVDHTEAISTSVATDLAAGEFLFSAVGRVDAAFTNLSEFHDNSVDVVHAHFNTLNSAGRSPAAIGTNLVAPYGLAGPVPVTPAFMGWA